ncbi:MAG: EscI/YscI/HrpB family type III secretion system inner rod protein [Thermodesulforhabdaceae bacterium]|jgi:hypothetical protein
MIESVHTKQIIEKSVTEAGTSQAEPDKSVAPDDQDVQRFEEAMAEGPHQAAATPEAVPSTPPDPPANISLGDKILQSLEGQRSSFHSRIEEIGSALSNAPDGKEVTPAELLRLQWKLQEATLELQVTTKVVEKGDEGVSTLLKNQG